MSERDHPSGAPEREMPTERRTDLEPDVERIHRAIVREPRDPGEGREPAPWWLWAAAILAIFWGGWYLGRYGGDFGLATHVALRRADDAVVDQAAEQKATEQVDPVALGQQVYGQNCQSCHQQNGQGLAGVFPPIVGSEWVTGPEETVVRILLNGLQGPIQVAGATYNGLMPAWRDPLSNEQIAGVITYIRQWKPNAAGPVDAELVARLRDETKSRTTAWTAAELRALEGGGAGGGSR